MKKFLVALLVGVAAVSAGAQASIAGRQRELTVTVGAMASGFAPSYRTDEYANNPIFGPGAYVDVHVTHWIQIEGEARWLRYNTDQYDKMHQDNYLIGPRVPVKRFGKFQTYGKFLIGAGKFQFPLDDPIYKNGSFTDMAFGGTLDYKLGHRWTVRAADFEYQLWPRFLPNAISPDTSINTLHPYGVSVGIGYRVF